MAKEGYAFQLLSKLRCKIRYINRTLRIADLHTLWAHTVSQLETVRGALIVRDGCVLLVKRAVEPFKDYWDIPGGFLEAGEHPLDGMRREVREETGLEVRVSELLGVYMDRCARDGEEIFTLNHYYIVEPVSGALRAADDVSAYEWFPVGALPEKIAFKHAKMVLKDLKKRIGHGRTRINAEKSPIINHNS